MADPDGAAEGWLQPPPPMTTALEPPLDRLTLDERHNRIVARLTRRLARRQPEPSPTPMHDLLVPVLHADLVEAGEPPARLFR